MNELKKCPVCGYLNDDNWPLPIKKKIWAVVTIFYMYEIKDGGCQTCWEQHCSDTFWEQWDSLFIKQKDN